MKRKKVLILVGSPKAAKSTSGALAAFLSECLVGKGMEVEQMRIVSSVKSTEGLERLYASLGAADAVVLCSPLYIDSLPAPVVKMMEQIALRREGADSTRRPAFIAVSNSGFPEAFHSEISLAICRKFAAEAGLEWRGGLALGGGEAIAGEPLRTAGGKARFVRRSLELTADAISADVAVPEEAIRLMARPSIPKWMYLLIGGIGWKWRALRKGALGKISNRPYNRT